MTKIPSGKTGLNAVNFGKSAIPGDNGKNQAAAKEEKTKEVQIEDAALNTGLLGTSQLASQVASQVALKGKINTKSDLYANITESVNFAGEHLKELQATEKFFETEDDYLTAIKMQEAAVKKEFKK